MRDAARSFADERFTKRCRGETIFDLDAGAAALHLTRRRGIERDAEVVPSSGTGQARVQGGVEHALAVAQKRFHMFECETLQKIFRGRAGPRRKEPMKMKGD